MNVKMLVKSGLLLLSKNKSAILAGTSIVSGVGAVIFAVRGTIKADAIVREMEEDRLAIASEATHELVDVKHEEIALTKKEVVKCTWKKFIPCALMLGTSITSSILSHKIDAKRIAAATAALALSETAYKELENKTILEVGEEKFNEIRKKIAQDKVDKNPPMELKQIESKGVVMPSGGDRILFRENITGNGYFYMSWKELNEAVADANLDAFDGCGLITVNDLLDHFGLDFGTIGDSLGWRIERGALRYTYDSCITPDGRSCIVLQFPSPELI